MAGLRSLMLIFTALIGTASSVESTAFSSGFSADSQIKGVKTTISLSTPTNSLQANQPPAQEQAKPLSAKSMELGGMTLQFTEDQVRQKLGTPSQVNESDNPLLGAKERYFVYFKNGIQGVQLIQDAKTGKYQVVSILAIAAPASTPEGIKPGDPLDKLLKTYGKPSSVYNMGNVDTLYYLSDDGIPAELSFTVLLDTNRITEVGLSRRNLLNSKSKAIAPQAPQPSFQSQRAQKQSAPISSLEIASISQKSTEAQVRQRLGTPQKVETKYWACCGNVKFLNYGKTQVGLLEGQKLGTFNVFSLATESPDLATRDGVKVGDRLEKAIATYGKNYQTSEKAGSKFITYWFDAYAATLSFRVQNGRITKIQYDYQLN
jgi:outer membrane protein assembly factor BamE (lipoprotein component of BamABCDE complex)